MTAEKDRVGEWTTRKYDATGRVEEVVRPMSATRTAVSSDTLGYEEPSSGVGSESSPAAPVRPDAVETTVVDAEDRTTTHDMNRFGRTIRTDRGGLVSEFRYDRLQRPILAVQPDGTVIRTLHDWKGNTHKQTHEQLEAVHGDVATTTIARETDGFDRIVSSTIGAGTATITYDDATNTITHLSAAGRVSAQRLNARGQLCAETDLFGTHWRYDYDARGNLSTIIHGVGALACNASALPNARTTILMLAVDGALLERIDPLGRPTEERYDAHGRLGGVPNFCDRKVKSFRSSTDCAPIRY